LNYLITGGAGFIGSNMASFLIKKGHNVIVLDNLSTGKKIFINELLKEENFKFILCDLLNKDLLNSVFENHIDFVYHFAANADVRFGLNQPGKDLEQNTIATYNLLEAMRVNKVKKIAFSSTGSVYGETNVFPTPEDAPFPIQTSLYGASKLACEALISAYCEGFGFRGYIYRFVSILGQHYTHGHVYDFTKSLIENPNKLNVLGNGLQQKSYLNIFDCVRAMYLIEGSSNEKICIYNLATPELINVNQSIKFISELMKVDPKISYGKEDRGWVGDNPKIFLDIKKVVSLGWQPKFTIKDSILQTASWLLANKWVYNSRETK